MDLSSSHRLVRQTRYESHPPPYFLDPHHNAPNYSLLDPYSPQPTAHPPAAINRILYYDPRFVQPSGDIHYLPSTGRSSPRGFDHRSLPSALLLGDADPALIARGMVDSKHYRFMGGEFDWKSHQEFMSPGERNSRCHDSFHYDRGKHSPGLVEDRADAHFAFVHRPPVTSVVSFSDLNIGNDHGQFNLKKKKIIRDLPSEDRFCSRYSSLRTVPTTSTMAAEQEFNGDAYSDYNGRKKMACKTDILNKLSENLPKQKPSAFSRIQRGLSVWERLEENPNRSPSSYLSSAPLTSNETKANDAVFNTSVKASTHLSKVVDTVNADLRCPENVPIVTMPIRGKKNKKKNMTHLREKTVISIALRSKGSIEKPSNGKKKKGKTPKKEKDAVLNSHGSIIMKGSKINSNTMLETKKIEMPSSCTKKAKKIKVVNECEQIEAAKLCSQARMETLKGASDADCTEILNIITKEGDIRSELIDDSKLNQSNIIEILDNSDEEISKLGKILNLDANANSQSSECINDDAFMQYSVMKLEEKDTNCRRNPDFDGFVSSSLKNERNELPAGDAAPLEVSFPAGSENNPLMCNSDELEIDMTIDEVEVIKNCATSFTDISNKIPKQEFEGDFKENVMLTIKDCCFTFPDSSETLAVDSNYENASNNTISLDKHLIRTSNSCPINIVTNESSDIENRVHVNKDEAFIRSVISSDLEKPAKNLWSIPDKPKLLLFNEHKKQPSNSNLVTNRENFPGLKKYAPHSGIMGRHRTWLREGILREQVTKRMDKLHNSSYFRKGNSLIRKLAAESKSELSQNAKTLHQGPIASCIPPLSKSQPFSMNNCIDFTPTPVIDQGNDTLCSTLESRKIIEISTAKNVTYVKRKMNQLVAAPRPENATDSSKLPAEMLPSAPFSSSFLYYRRKRNQIIRNSALFNGKILGNFAGDANSNDSFCQVKKLTLMEKLANVLHKRIKPSRFSQVWTLSGDKLSRKSIAKLGFRRNFPHVIPWKRAIDWKKLMISRNIPISSRFSSTLLSRKLQSTRKRDMVYKVSNGGFSLRKSGVLSVGGSSLKWSKSIEKRSKKASEEATLAVAEVERKKREKKKCKTTSSDRDLKRGERIFRVGSARYKMDSSKRTLVRMPDVQPPSSKNQLTGNNTRRSFVPRRLVVGNNEYVQIGNGNQLVRDPTKTKRLLANDKVRWSLHTARSRLARKRQFCIFFTRFGKCNKSEGKCPYLHESNKDAVCTKFLKGYCFDAKCKFAHKVIQERMPDCSYFLKGLCTNDNCPYRHVNVNADASLCDDFIRGLCADGDQVFKKKLAGKFCSGGCLELWGEILFAFRRTY